jgi:hypothetical protein
LIVSMIDRRSSASNVDSPQWMSLTWAIRSGMVAMPIVLSSPGAERA